MIRILECQSDNSASLSFHFKAIFHLDSITSAQTVPTTCLRHNEIAYSAFPATVSFSTKLEFCQSKAPNLFSKFLKTANEVATIMNSPFHMNIHNKNTSKSELASCPK
jgi:hypothetical protein